MPEATTAAEIKQNFSAEFQRRFREGRKAARLSLAEVGEAAGVSLQAISQFEAGRQRLDLEVFAKACEAVRLDVRWVLFGRGEMFDGQPPVTGRPRAARRTLR